MKDNNKLDSIHVRKPKSEHEKDIEFAKKTSPNLKNLIPVRFDHKTTLYFKPGTSWEKINQYIEKLRSRSPKSDSI